MSGRPDNDMFADMVERAAAERRARERAARTAMSQPSRHAGTIGPAPGRGGSALGEPRQSRGRGRYLVLGLTAFAALFTLNRLSPTLFEREPDDIDVPDRTPATIDIPDIDTPDAPPMEEPADAADRPPKLIAEFPFRYPVDAMDEVIDGSAELEFRVDRGGRVDGLVIRRLSHPAFDAPIRRAMASRIYRPARRGGEAVRSERITESYVITPTSLDRLRMKTRLQGEALTDETRPSTATERPELAPGYTRESVITPPDIRYDPLRTEPVIEFVALGYVVGPDGRATDVVHLAGTPENAFKAELALSKAEFRPAMRDGSPVASRPRRLEHVFMPSSEQLAVINARRMDKGLEPRAPFFEDTFPTRRARGRYEVPWRRNPGAQKPSFTGTYDPVALSSLPSGNTPRRAVHAPKPVLPAHIPGPVTCRAVLAIDSAGEVSMDSVSAFCPNELLTDIAERALLNWRYDAVSVDNRNAPTRLEIQDLTFAPR